MAKVLVDYCTEVREKDTVLIQASLLAVPLVEATYKECVMRGAYPEVSLVTDNMQDIFYTHCHDHQLDYCSPFLRYYIDNLDVIITIIADYNVKHLTNIPSEKITRKTKANEVINATILLRGSEGTLRWNLTAYPTHSMAQEANMSLMEYEDFVYSACFLTHDDPQAEWRKLSGNQKGIATLLEKKSVLQFVGEDTDLTMSVGGRKWISSDGHHNFPSGEVFTGPVEDSAEGTIRFTYPGIYMGKEVEDVTLTFKQGRVVKAESRKGNDLLQLILAVDEGAKRIGEIALGTNYGITKFTKNILFDEKIGGTIHLALGRSLLETGGKNSSAIHWDLVKDMKNGRIYADGELFYENGKVVTTG